MWRKAQSSIEIFTKDVLVKTILGLKKHIDEDTIGKRISSLGQKGAKHTERLLVFNKSYLDSLSTAITLDLDSTEQTVYGNQDGAAKGIIHTRKEPTATTRFCVMSQKLNI